MERPNQMMQNGLNTMQRPQSGNQMQQIHAMIMSNLKARIGTLPPGWQSTFDLGQRASRVMQLVTTLRLLQQDAPKCLQIAEGFEERCIQESPTKEIYFQKIQSKLAEIQAKRAQQASANMMGNMPMNNPGAFPGMPQNDMNGFNMMQNHGMAGMGAMGGMNGVNGMNAMNMNANVNMNMNNFMGGGQNLMNGGQNLMNGGMPNQMAQTAQGFPAQLQRPMQASPLPLQQPQTNTLEPASLQNMQGPAQPPNMNQPNSQQQNHAGANPQGQNFGPQQAEVLDLARRMYHSTNDEKKVILRNNFLSQYDPQRRDQILTQGGDPLVRFFMLQARDMLTKKRQAQMGQLNGQAGAMQNANNNGTAAANNMQPNGSQPGMPNFDLTSMLGQQATAIKAGEDGEQVVPASNNQNLPLGGQANMSQGLNPQMLANQNGQAGNQIQLQQILALEREKQRQRQQQQQQQQTQQAQQNQQNQLAQNQAKAQQQAQQAAQAQQLRGMPGGLNTPNLQNGAQVNSPAFKMLNQPVSQPGQAMPSTPQPARPQNAPNAPANGANQVIQHHQNMLNQNSQQIGQGQALDQRQQLINSLPPQVREKLSGLQPGQVNEVLTKWKNAQTTGPMNPQQAAAMLPPNMNPNNLAGNNPHFMMSNMPNVSAIPDFNAQPPPNHMQQGAAMDPMAQQRLQHLQQQQALKARALDMRPFPRQILSTLAIAVPDNVTEWGKLKTHIHNNQAVLPPNTLPKLQAAQNSYFAAHPEEVSAAIAALQQRLQQMAEFQQRQGHPGQHQPHAQQQQQQQQNLAPPNSMPNGQAPQAQMTQPNASMPQPQPPQVPNASMPNMNQNQLKMPQPPTQQEIAQFRQKIPSGANMTDEQIKAFVMEKRMQQIRQQSQQAQQQALQAQQQVNMRNQMQRAQLMANGVQHANLAQGNQAQLPAGQRPPQQPQPPQQQTANGQAPGQKRAHASNDDVVEIANPNLGVKGAAPPPPNMQPNQNQALQQGQLPRGSMRLPNQEDLARMTPEQRSQTMMKLQQMEALRKAQITAQQPGQLPQGVNQQQGQPQLPGQAPPGTNAGVQNSGQTEADRAKGSVWYREVAMANPKGNPVQLDAASKEQLITAFRKWWTPIQNIDKTFAAALRTLGENKVKEAMRIRHVFLQNVADSNGTIKDYLSIGLQDWKPMDQFLMSYFTALKVIRGNSDMGRQFQQQQQQVQQPMQQQVQQQTPHTQQQQARPIPFNAGQAEQQRAQATAKTAQAAAPEKRPTQQNTRKASASAKVPAAPTEKKKFDWEIRNGLTAAQLKLPAQKKRKTDQDSPDSRASASAGSPVITQAVPEQMAKPAPVVPPKPVEPEKAKFKCDDLLCDASIVGFDSEEKLAAHKLTEHGPVENAFEFLVEQTAYALGLDKDGNDKNAAKASGKAPAKTGQLVAGRVSTPTAGTKEGTPFSGGKAIAKPSSSGTGKDMVEGKSMEQEKTLLEAMAERVGFEMPKTKDKTTTEVTTDTADDLFLGGLEASFLDSDLFINDWSELAIVTDWGFPPFEPDSSPELTPSSRASDVSQTEKLRINMSWDAFGNNDTGVPEILTLQKLGLDDGAAASSSSQAEDTTMADADAGTNETTEQTKDKDDAAKTADDLWNWHEDLVSWDWTDTNGGPLDGDFSF